MSESGVYHGSQHDQDDVDEFEPDPVYESASKARFYAIVALICAALTIWYLFNNVFLAPVFGFVGAFCSWRGIKNGAYRPAMVVLMLICLLPAIFAVIGLLLLLPNLPHLSFSHVRYIQDK